MKCPYCKAEMQHGRLRCDGRSGVYWIHDNEDISLWKKLSRLISGTGNLSAVPYDAIGYTYFEGDYCTYCKKMIFQTEIEE